MLEEVTQSMQLWWVLLVRNFIFVEQKSQMTCYSLVGEGEEKKAIRSESEHYEKKTQLVMFLWKENLEEELFWVGSFLSHFVIASLLLMRLSCISDA